MAYENLKAKYNLTDSEIKVAIETVAKSIGNIVGPMQMMAIADLLAYGDIPVKGE